MDANNFAELRTQSDVDAISRALRSARELDRTLAEFPGPLPLSMDEAYKIQSLSIDEWPDEVAGWKVGGVAPNLQKTYGAKRLAGPIFSNSIRRAPASGVLDVPAFRGSVAIEAEWIFELGDCSALTPANMTEADIENVIRAAYIGVEIASSPVVDINSYGPAVVASDFGNNYGLVIGESVDDWSVDALSATAASVEIDGECVGAKHALRGFDGPYGAVQFLIEHLLTQGWSEPSGTYVSSGAITGVHETDIGSLSRIEFGGIGDILLRLVSID